MKFRDFLSTTRVYSLLLTGCLLLNPVPDTFGFNTHDDFQNVDTLTHHVHKDFWVIKYRYADNCSPVLIKEDAFPEVVTSAIQTWLQELREYTVRPIINDFRIQRHAGPDRGDADLYCIIHGPATHKELSYAVTSGNSPVIGIVVGDSQTFDPDLKFEVLHEVGHAFGLGDTYITDDKTPAGRNVSTGGLAGTAGKHPGSVMSGDVRDLILSRDDQGGVLWVYTHIHEGMPLRACEEIFPDYHYTETPWPGCEPKDPLRDALKYGTAFIVSKILRDDDNINVNALDEETFFLLLQDGETAWQVANEDLDVKTANAVLELAMLNGHATVVEHLVLREDLDLDLDHELKFAKTGQSLLHLVVTRGKGNGVYRIVTALPIILKLYAREDFDVNVRNPKTGFTALQRSMLMWHEETQQDKPDWVLQMEILIAREDVEVNVRDPINGNTVLHYAVRYSNDRIAKTLLAHPKINVNIQNNDNLTPMEYARSTKRWHLFRILENHPTAKQPEKEWLVSSKGKLATTWGALKRRTRED